MVRVNPLPLTQISSYLGLLLVLVDYFTQQLPEKGRREDILLRLGMSQKVLILSLCLIDGLAIEF